ncbi:LuxR family transcriptional regulator [Roseivirga sp. UBA1976]|uniref:response regulator transcription factor n=1 Tax=Roseivirga sp. UBA1976 TaxID=1947386 RepID=UPI00257DC14C|nr:LuxR family transcriptional regulator [Roseivirga sp. UBA1976]MEC7756167.1 LuxR C-terminal-related transcriptional regulator [Bacteroidota bacterium]|tara:strand:- start:5279 stop:5968 length:690 start_codon:yes stop_codon:yes gene_type:complete
MYQTEQEIFENEQQFVCRLSVLFETNNALFREIADFVPFGVHTSDTDHLGITSANRTIEQWLEEDEKAIVLAGTEMIVKRSHPEVVKVAMSKSKAQLRNEETIIEHFQYIFLEGKMRWVLSLKTHLNSNEFLTLGYYLPEFGVIGKHLEKLLAPVTSEENWKRFYTLTKREVEILNLISRGLSSSEIADNTFTSKHTVDTHRRNILNKLAAKSTRQAYSIYESINLVLL